MPPFPFSVTLKVLSVAETTVTVSAAAPPFTVPLNSPSELKKSADSVSVLPAADRLITSVKTCASDRSMVPALETVVVPVLTSPVNWSSCADVSVSPPEKPVMLSRLMSVAVVKFAVKFPPSSVSSSDPPS